MIDLLKTLTSKPNVSTKDVKMKELLAGLAKLPIMKIDHPISIYYGYKLYDIIKIIRNDRYLSVLTPKSIMYRVVMY